MTYEPLHHKYRPQTFADLVGQDAIATTLTNAIRTERIAPAYLFTGSRGTGKTSSARILAKSLNCLQSNQPTERPCGLCDTCQGIAKGSTIDVIEIDAASNTGVENIRELIERAQFAPMQCRYKVYVIDECHQLSGAAFNALLKTLEEPPKQVVFVLATTDPQRVLPTIISRCQKFDFRRIPLEAMVANLKMIARAENIKIKDEALTLVSQVAQGGLRDAQSLLDQLSLLAGEVSVERVWDLVGAVPERDLMELLRAIALGNAPAVLEKVRNLMDRGREPLIVLQNLAGFYRDLLIAKTAPNRNDLVSVTAPTWMALCEFVQGWDMATIFKGQKHLKDSEVQIKNTTQPRLWLEVTLLGLLTSPDTILRHEDRSVTLLECKTSDNDLPQTSPASTTHQQLSTSSSGLESKEATNKVSLPQPTPEAQTSEAAPPLVQPENSEPTPSASVSEVSMSRSDLQNGAIEHQMEAQNEVAAQDSGVEQVWQQVLAYLQPRATQVLLRQHCHLLAFDKAVACVGISSQPLLNLATSRLPNIEAAFEQVFNYKVKVNLQVASVTDSKTAAFKEGHTSSKSTDSVPTLDVHKEAKPSPSQPPSKVQPQARTDTHKASYASENTPPPEPQPFLFQQPPEPLGTELDADEVAIAAQSLAEFFKAEIINLKDDLEKEVEAVNFQSLPEPAATLRSQPAEMISPATELDREEDEDIPF